MDATIGRVRYFRKRAEEIRKVAEGVTDEECQHALLILAERYEQISLVLMKAVTTNGR